MDLVNVAVACSWSKGESPPVQLCFTAEEWAIALSSVETYRLNWRYRHPEVRNQETDNAKTELS